LRIYYFTVTQASKINGWHRYMIYSDSRKLELKTTHLFSGKKINSLTPNFTNYIKSPNTYFLLEVR